MKWITGFLAAGLASFVLFGCMSGTSFEAKPSPAAVAAPAPMAPAVPTTVMAAPVQPIVAPALGSHGDEAAVRPYQGEPQILLPQQIMQIDQDEEDTGMFSRRGPIRHKQKTLKKDIN